MSLLCETGRETDREEIVSLWRRNLPEASAGRYPWLYDRGPAQSWLLRDDRREAVGAIGLMARRMRIFGAMATVGQGVDMNVDRRHRSLGPAMTLQRAITDTVRQGVCRLIYSFPNDKSEAIAKRCGCRHLAQVSRWVLPLESEKVLATRLRSPLLRKPASLAVNAVLRALSPETHYTRPHGLDVYVTDAFDRRFDVLWESAADRYHIVGQRTASFLQWRFGRNPDVHHRVLCIAGPDGALLGYLIYRCHEGTAYLSDFFVAEPSCLDLLLAEGIRLARQDHVGQLTTIFVGSDQITRRLRRFGFHRRTTPWKMWVYVDTNRDEGKWAFFLDEQNWYLTRADIDTDF